MVTPNNHPWMRGNLMASDCATWSIRFPPLLQVALRLQFIIFLLPLLRNHHRRADLLPSSQPPHRNHHRRLLLLLTMEVMVDQAATATTTMEAGRCPLQPPPSPPSSTTIATTITTVAGRASCHRRRTQPPHQHRAVGLCRRWRASSSISHGRRGQVAFELGRSLSGLRTRSVVGGYRRRLSSVAVSSSA
ncbi:hypothetical protein Dimus_003729 [Dionaea muscipula]